MERRLPFIFHYKRLLLFLLFSMLAASPALASGPVRLFDKSFPEPLGDISQMNKDGRMLVVRLGATGMAQTGVLSLDKRGNVEVVQDIKLPEKLTVPVDRLWMLGDTETGDTLTAAHRDADSAHIYMAHGGGSYSVVYQGPGSYWELRNHDSQGRLRFIATPKDGYGLKAVITSADGSRVLVVDESPLTGSATGELGQRIYFYDGDGRLIADHDMGDELENWLDASEGFMAEDGSYFVAVRGRGKRTGGSVVLFGADGKVAWERSYYESHKLVEDLGGLFRVRGGSGSFISFIRLDGEQVMLERAGYGFEFWMSPGRKYAYIIVFKPFDVARSGVVKAVQDIFPGTAVSVVDLNGLMPEGCSRPAVRFAPDGAAFIHYCIKAGEGFPSTSIGYFDSKAGELWRDTLYSGGIVPRFVNGSRGFALTYGRPVTRLIYYEVR